MRNDKQNAIIKNPIPILIGNTGLSSDKAHEYTYTSAYIVDDKEPNYSESYNSFLVFNQIENKWALFLTSYSLYRQQLRYNYFPQLSTSIGTYYMNGFVNNDAGYPAFYPDDPDYYSTCFFYDKNINEWSFGFACKTISGEVLTQRAIDTTDCRTGNFAVSHNISAFVNDKKEIGDPIYKNYKLVNGDLTIPSSLLKFRDNDGNVISGKIINNTNSSLRSEDSPRIISGEPCLGYYYHDNYYSNAPYVVGSICIGTEDLNTVPPIVGQNINLIILESYDPGYHEYYFSPDYGSNCPDIYPGSISGIWDESAYLWVGKTIDKNKDEWNLFQIKSYRFGDIGPYYQFNTFILLSGGFPNIDPCTAEKFWYMQSNQVELFTYSALSGGLTFKAYPDGADLHLKIVGLTNINADELKHHGLEKSTNIPIYIGNWLAPQATWRNE